MDETEIQRNRLTIEEIRSIEKFCKYKHGSPSTAEQFIVNMTDIEQEDEEDAFIG